MKERDKTLDNLRGFAMLWVIVVHVLYWGDFFDNRYINLMKSFCLFEMPLFFFVTGAGNSFSRAEGYFSFVFKRFKRMLIPYWIFALLCAALTVVHYAVTEGVTLAAGAKILITWLIPADRQITSIPYLTWALWFVPVYLCVVLILPLLKRMKEAKRAPMFLLPIAALFVLSCVLRLGWIQNVVFYTGWTYAGLFYGDIMPRLKERRFRGMLGLSAAGGTAAVVLLYVLGHPIDMQYNKFPPNLAFLFFSVVMMSLLFLLLPTLGRVLSPLCCCKPVMKLLELYSTRSMTIFLYQVFAFLATVPLTKLLIPDLGAVTPLIRTVVCLILTVPACAALALGLGWTEKLGSKKREVRHEQNP